MLITKKTMTIVCMVLGLFVCSQVNAGPSQRFVGELFWVAGEYCPDGSLAANGQSITVSGESSPYNAFVSVMAAGTPYNPVTKTILLPNLSGAAPIGSGQTIEGDNYTVGESSKFYQSQISTECPPHKHSVSENLTFTTSSDAASSNDPSGAYLGTTESNQYISGVCADTGNMNHATTTLSGSTSANAGASSSMNVTVDTTMPYTALLPCIAYDGLFPHRD